MTAPADREGELIPTPETKEVTITTTETPKKSRWGSLFGKVADAATEAGGAMQKATGVVGNAVENAGSAIAQKAESAGDMVTSSREVAVTSVKKVTRKVSSVAGNTGNAIAKQTENAGKMALDTGSTITGAVGKATEMVGNTAGSASSALVQTTGAIANTTLQTGDAIAKASLDVAGNIGKTAIQAPARLADVLKLVNENPWMGSVIETLQGDWILTIVEQVDVTKAKEAVIQLQEKCPEDSPTSISHKIMLQKALLVGATHVATGLSGASILTMGFDLAATTALQAEMVYQIAYSYGFDMQEPERKGEVLAIFGLAFGSSKAVEAGLGLLKTVPLAGAAISGSANAALIYGLGYAACRFYEAKLNPAALEESVETMQEENEIYLEEMIAQETLMDRVLVHMILAGYPDRTWVDIVPELEPMNLSPASLDAIAQSLENPPSLEELLAQLSPDFVPPLLLQCEKMAELDETITPEEARVLEAIRQCLPDEMETETLSVVS